MSKLVTKRKIAVIPGDGIGKEVVPEGLRVLDAAATKFDLGFEWKHFDWSCDYYLKNGAMMPPDWKEQIRRHDPIFLRPLARPPPPPPHPSPSSLFPTI